MFSAVDWLLPFAAGDVWHFEIINRLTEAAPTSEPLD